MSEGDRALDIRRKAELLAALRDERAPLTQYFIGLMIGRFVSDAEMRALADEGLVSCWARWWPGQAPAGAPSYALTDRGAEFIEREFRGGE